MRRKPKSGKPKSKGSAPPSTEVLDSSKTKGAKKPSLGLLVKLIFPRMLGKPGLYLFSYIAVLTGRILITVRLADIGGQLGGYMGARKWNLMFSTQGVFGLWCMAGAGVTALMKWLEKRVAITLRRLLLERAEERYLNSKTNAFFHVGSKLPDAPARITSDLDQFATESVHMLGYILKPSIDVLNLCFTIGARNGIASLGIFLAFFWVSSITLQRVKSTMRISLKQRALQTQNLEAAFRDHHNKLHLYREQVALLRGVERERESLRSTFAQLKRHLDGTHASYFLIDVLNSYVLKYGGAMCAYSVLIPPVYFSNPDSFSSEMITANYLADSSLLLALANAIKDLADSATELPRVRGLAERVCALFIEIDNLKPPAIAVEARCGEEVDAGISLTNVSIRPPNPSADVLAAGLTMEIPKGHHTVVRGPNGIGKTSLFRTLGGIWSCEPPVPGETKPRIVVPGKSKVRGKVLPGADSGLYIMPQDAYFYNGTLFENIIYPQSNTSALTDEAFAELMQVVGLPEFVDRYDRSSVADWANVLSGGQKQRIAWARLYFHRPDFALVDEATSAVSEEMVDRLYSYAKSLGTTIVTISHRASDVKHHIQALDLAQGSKWKVTTLPSQ